MILRKKGIVPQQGGLIKILIIFVIVFFILSVLNIDIRSIVDFIKTI